MDYEKELADVGIRVTAVRTLIWRTIREKMHEAFSLADIELALLSVDKSTLFRALVLFTEKGLLHIINDGSGSNKYCVCHCDDHNHHHGHVHLTCVSCHKTWCLEDVPIPTVPIPQSFEWQEAEYIVKAVCPKCRREREKRGIYS